VLVERRKEILKEKKRKEKKRKELGM